MSKFSMVSLGCAKNQVDSEVMLKKMEEAGFVFTADIPGCDVVIINTCGFIIAAKEEAIENILEVVKLKNEGSINGIVVCGCLTERYKDEFEKEFPEVDAILGTGSYQKVVEAAVAASKNSSFSSFETNSGIIFSGDRIISTPPYLAYLKISEGCDNCCSYCTIPLIRGRFRSRTIEDLVNEANKLADGGVEELILIAQDTTRYGEDLYGKYSLVTLVNELSKIDKILHIWIMYTYPDRINNEIIEMFRDNPKVVKYIDVPIQHASTKILKAMNRSYTVEDLTRLFKDLRAAVPDIVLRTTVIVGFPGEDKKDFASLAQFVKTVEFDRLGVFPYSKEEGTKAFDLANQIDEDEKLRRMELIMEQQQRIMEKRNKRWIGKTLCVMTEGFDQYAESYYGRSYRDAYDVDGKVFFQSEIKLSPGTRVDVKIDYVMDYDIFGKKVQT